MMKFIMGTTFGMENSIDHFTVRIASWVMGTNKEGFYIGNVWKMHRSIKVFA